MSKAINKQQIQDIKHQKNLDLYFALKKLILENYDQHYSFYSACLKNQNIKFTSKRTLQRAIQKCRKEIHNEKYAEIQIVNDRKRIMSREQILEVKQYLKKNNKMNMTKQNLTNLINTQFLSPDKKISEKSKFVYLNFDGYYAKASSKNKTNSKTSSQNQPQLPIEQLYQQNESNEASAHQDSWEEISSEHSNVVMEIENDKEDAVSQQYEEDFQPYHHCLLQQQQLQNSNSSPYFQIAEDKSQPLNFFKEPQFVQHHFGPYITPSHSQNLINFANEINQFKQK